LKYEISLSIQMANVAVHRSSLPIWKCRHEIVRLVQSNDTVIIIGETGCGKSTQVPQFLIDSKSVQCTCIAITQPRRVSACSLARRVSFERRSKLGREVGYSVRFDSKYAPRTKIKFLTDGMLLSEILADPDLANYSVVILDEIHERTVQTDLLIGLLRALQSRRSLKLILMSATLHCQLFVDFFENPPILRVAGRMFPVGVFYLDRPESDYVDACSIAIIQLNQDLDIPGDFLVFMTGQEEIEELRDFLTSRPLEPPILVFPLFAALPIAQQQLIFDEAPPGFRKIILSTNIAETSVTIPGIKYVIDSGLVKIKSFNPATGVEILGAFPVTKAQAIQRAGRAGRESAGACFRLYTEQTFIALSDLPVAEIRRADLSSVVLRLLALGIENPLKFQFLERPPTELLRASLVTIYGLGALDDAGKLTTDGVLMARFPLAPKMTKLLLLAARSGCGTAAMTLLAMMSCENLFVLPKELRNRARKQHELYVDARGDHVTLVKIFQAFAKAPSPQQFCTKNFFSLRALEYAANVRRQLMDVARELNMDIGEDPGDEVTMDSLTRCIAEAFHENVARLLVAYQYQCVEDGTQIYIHPSSFAFNKSMTYIVFSERVETKRLYARWVSEVDPTGMEALLAAPTE
jgi:HrpA-like RNA helicase